MDKFSITGKVIHGDHVGRTLGYPTANVDYGDASRLIPKTGVYAALVNVRGKVLGGMANIGFRPTIENKGLTVEVFIFDFSEDIYGEVITVTFVERLRDELKFASLDELIRQMDRDEERAREILSKGL